MRHIGSAMALAALAIAMPVSAQEFDDSGPTVPRTSQSVDESQLEIDRLRAIIKELEREIRALKAKSGDKNDTVATGNLAGTWLGNVSCGRRQFTITYTVTEQIGRIGKGKFSYTGAATGTDEAQISPLPTQESPESYTIVTAKPNTYDYLVQIDGNKISGKATNANCKIYLERG